MSRDGRKTGGGSRKGKPNKATQEAREAIGRFVDGNAHRLQGWLDAIAEGQREPVPEGSPEGTAGEWIVKPDPEKAFTLFQSVIEYHVPKLARVENDMHLKHSGEVNVNVSFKEANGHQR